MNKTTIVSIIILILAVAVFSVIGLKASKKPGVYDQFATCLKDSGIKFYGAFWCPHCNNQKKLFGSSKSLLPYVECSTPNGQAQTQICIDKNITGYPTWEFADGTRPFQGEVSLSDLSAKTGCPLPVEDNEENTESITAEETKGQTDLVTPVTQ